jgi:hypothetical protein
MYTVELARGPWRASSEYLLTNEHICRILFDFSYTCPVSPPPPPSVVANNRAEFFLVGKPLKGEWAVSSLRCQFVDHDLISRG